MLSLRLLSRLEVYFERVNPFLGFKRVCTAKKRSTMLEALPTNPVGTCELAWNLDVGTERRRHR